MAYVVGIDGNEANVSNRVGSNVYAYEVLHALYAWLQKEPKFSVVVYVSSPPLDDLPVANEWWRYEVITHQPFWTLWRLPIELWRHRQIDLFYSPGHYLPSISPVPMIPTIMDIAFEFFPEQFKKKDYWQLHLLTMRSVAGAAHVIAISQATKTDIMEHYGRQSEDITVAYPGVPHNLHLPKKAVRERIKQSFALQKPFIIYVGTLQPRKNIERLVGAFEKVRANGWDGELVLAGKTGWKSHSIEERIATSSAKESIRQLGFVTDEEKYALITEAEALALPGLYEGFGIPPLEAIALGVIPVVSDRSSLPEVVGESGICVDPESIEDIARGIQQALAFTSGEKQKLMTTLQSHAEQFSWQRTGEVIGNVLWETLSGSRVM